MSGILKELAVLVKKAEDENPDEDHESIIRQASYQLQARQFLYRSKGRHRHHYETVIRYQEYFISLLDALNYDLEINEERGYVGILPREFVYRMSLNSTLLLFTLRYIYDEELMSFNSDESGAVSLTLDDFEMRSRQFTSRDLAKSSAELKNLLNDFIHIGIVEVGKDENEPEIERIKIYSSITSILSGDMLQRVDVYLRSEDICTTLNEDNNGDKE